MSAAVRLVLLSTMAVLAGCGDVKPVTKDALPIGRYQIVSGQYRYFGSDSKSLTGSVLLKIDTATGETYQFVAPDPHSLGAEWIRVKD